MKNLKTFYNSQTLKEIIQRPLPHKNFLLLRKKNYLIDLQEYTDLRFPSASRMQFLDVWKWCSAIFFLTPTRNIFAIKYV